MRGAQQSYDFKVVDNGVYVGIDGDENFWRDIGGELHTAKPLFKALTAFYKLRCGQLLVRYVEKGPPGFSNCERGILHGYDR